MANIQKLTYPYFTDGTTLLGAANLNPIIAKLNEVVDKVNGGVTPTQTVATPSISISGTTATISCSTSGATIRYAINETPTESFGTIITSGGTVDLSSYSSGIVIRAIAYKSGMTTSQVAQETYTPSVSPEAEAALAKFSNLSSTQQTKVTNLVNTLVSNGIYSKIHYMAMPNVASSVAEALQNVLSNVTPPAASNASISGGGLQLTSEGIINLTDMVEGTVDYDDFALCWGIEIDKSAVSATNRAFTLDSAGAGTPSRCYFEKSSSNFIYKGYDGNKVLSLDGNTSIGIMSHNKTGLTEKYCDNSAGTITSNADTTSNIGNNGLTISTNKAQSSGSYNDYFSGIYKFIMLTDSLTDAQITALNTAVRTFLS